VSEDEQAPKTIRYKRNTDLDPQLVWRGKDEQDAEDLNVDSVPIYIQEKIKPEAIISDLRRRSEVVRREREEQRQYTIPDLYQDFNGLSEPGTEFDFYQHDKNWSNRMILGDSLLVMTSLAEKEALKGQVQCIYMDPPYGIRFNSNWQPSTKSRDVKDGQADSLSREPEMIRAFRDTWNDGIHSYLSYLRDRLIVARDLLHDSGSIFVQIGDENVHRVRAMMDEVFGDENQINMIFFEKTSSDTGIF
jgi:adenine-specific DNA-methyltransferase